VAGPVAAVSPHLGCEPSRPSGTGSRRTGRVDEPPVETDGFILISEADRILCVREIFDIGREDARLRDEVPLVQVADSPTRRSKPKASVKAARSMKDRKRELVSSSSDWKLLCWPSVRPSALDAL
jgi:hypothetical protein